MPIRAARARRAFDLFHYLKVTERRQRRRFFGLPKQQHPPVWDVWNICVCIAWWKTDGFVCRRISRATFSFHFSSRHAFASAADVAGMSARAVDY